MFAHAARQTLPGERSRLALETHPADGARVGKVLHALERSNACSAQVSTALDGILGFGLAGLACSALLPLSISFGGSEFPRLTALVSGELIAFYQVGYGLAAFGVGPLHDRAGLPLST